MKKRYNTSAAALIYIIMWGIVATLAVPMRAQTDYFEPPVFSPVAPQWVAQAGGDGCHDVWFCHAYYFGELPDEAHIEITTAGWAEIFVNGRNIDSALLWPSVDCPAQAAVATSYDITRFMRQGVNSIAVDYAPRGSGCSGCRLCSADEIDRRLEWDGPVGELADTTCSTPCATTLPKGQIALRFYGVYADSTEFETSTDTTWQCHNGRRILTSDGGELIDSRLPEYRTGRLSAGDVRGWTSALSTPTAPADTTIRRSAAVSGMRLTSTIVPVYEGTSGGTVSYKFAPNGCFGLLRLTLRDCYRGQMVKAGKVRYICSGNIDEQAYAKFTPHTISSVDINGSKGFSRSNIYMIEGVELK